MYPTIFITSSCDNIKVVHALACHVMPCLVMSCHVMSCHIISSCPIAHRHACDEMRHHNNIRHTTDATTWHTSRGMTHHRIECHMMQHTYSYIHIPSSHACACSRMDMRHVSCAAYVYMYVFYVRVCVCVCVCLCIASHIMCLFLCLSECSLYE